jgi:hypothetical protein
MTEVQKKYVELEKKYQQLKELQKELSETGEALFNELGEGGSFQDEEGTVYKAAKCEGKYVYFTPFEIKRTRRPGEKSGSLSLKEAREDGYTLE